MQLSKNLLLSEVIKSQTAIRKGIDNTPNNKHLFNLKLIADNVFQPLRDWYGKPITISSGYRSPELNSAIGGSLTSQHSNGQALDLDTVSDNLKLFNYIKSNLPFDQLIYEFGDDDNPAWVHVSYSRDNNRGQVLRAVKVNGKTKYLANE
jgi:hypothetical protein